MKRTRSHCLCEAKMKGQQSTLAFSPRVGIAWNFSWNDTELCSQA